MKTNVDDIGRSVVEVRASGHSRNLTTGELAVARQVFGDFLDYSSVRIHNHGYWLFFGFQDKHTAVTPNGEMYFPKPIYKDDFSLRPRDAALFVHEVVHVWQHQLGYAVRWNGLFVSSKGPAAFRYVLQPGAALSDYNMEQQGDHHFRLLHDRPAWGYREREGIPRHPIPVEGGPGRIYC